MLNAQRPFKGEQHLIYQLRFVRDILKRAWRNKVIAMAVEAFSAQRRDVWNVWQAMNSFWVGERGALEQELKGWGLHQALTARASQRKPKLAKHRPSSGSSHSRLSRMRFCNSSRGIFSWFVSWRYFFFSLWFFRVSVTLTVEWHCKKKDKQQQKKNQNKLKNGRAK